MKICYKKKSKRTIKKSKKETTLLNFPKEVKKDHLYYKINFCITLIDKKYKKTLPISILLY